MESSEFQTVMLRIFAVGLLVVGLGTVALVIAFRALGEKSERRGVATLIVAIAFIVLVCALLFRWSYAAR